MANTLTKDGYSRIVYRDAVHWVLDSNDQVRLRRLEYYIVRFPFVPDYHLCDIEYYIVRFPFVPDYHLCDMVAEDYNPKAWQQGHVSERPLQQFKTLTQALAVLRVIEGSRP